MGSFLPNLNRKDKTFTQRNQRILRLKKKRREKRKNAH